MRPTAQSDAFEHFQARVQRVSAWVAIVAVAGVLASQRGYTPLAGGLALGFAGSLAGLALKVASLRRLGRRPDAVNPRRAGLAAVGRLAVYAAALGPAAATEHVDLWGAAAGLVLANAVTVVLAALESRRSEAQA